MLRLTSGPVKPKSGYWNKLRPRCKVCCMVDMTTRLKGTLKREVSVDGAAHTVTLTSTGLKLVPKGRRKGLELNWKDLLSGEHALAVALSATLQTMPEPAKRPSAKRERKRSAAAKRHLRVVGTDSSER